MIEAIAQQPCANAGHNTQQGPQGEVARHRGFDRIGINRGWGNHPPGHALLGDFELEGFTGPHQAGKVVLGDLQAGLDGVELLDQGRLAQELAVQFLLLLARRGDAPGIEAEGGINGLQLVGLQQRLQLIEAGLEAAHHRGIGPVTGAGVGELGFHLHQLLQQALIGIAHRKALVLALARVAGPAAGADRFLEAAGTEGARLNLLAHPLQA